MADIFLSYAEEDRETARTLAHVLELAGWSVWWDRRIPPGRSWRDLIEEALAAMRCMVVLWSSHSVDSAWVCEEAEEGRRRRVLLPALIEQVDPPLGFRSIQAADLTDWAGEAEAAGVQMLVSELETMLGRPRRRNRRARVGEPAPPAETVPHGRRASMATVVAGAVIAIIAVVGLVLLWRDGNESRMAGDGAPPAAVAPVPAPPAASSGGASEPMSPSAGEVVGPPAGASVTGTNEVPEPVPAAAPEAPRPTSATGAVASSPDAAVAPKPKQRTAAVPARCTAILERVGVGEQLGAEELAYLNKECRK